MLLRKEKTLFDEMRSDKDAFMKNKDMAGLAASRFIIGEIQRDADKDYSDEKVIERLFEIKKSMLKNDEPDYMVVSLVSSYLPEPVSGPEVREWLARNGHLPIVLKEMKNPMKVIGEVQRHFSGREINSKMVKDIIAELIA